MTEIDPIENALASALAPDGEVFPGDADRLRTLIDSVLQTPTPSPPTATSLSKGILVGAGAVVVGAALFFFLRKPEPPPVAPSVSTPPVVSVMPSAPTATAEVPAMSIDALPVVPTATSTAHALDATVFARANEARRKSRDDDAIAGYRTLQQTFPSSQEAQASHVALGRLLLDKRADYDGALAQFDAYLASPNPGVLEEEALIGRALALQHLGRATDERRAWQLLLDKYPDSIYAEKARARLAH